MMLPKSYIMTTRVNMNIKEAPPTGAPSDGLSLMVDVSLDNLGMIPESDMSCAFSSKTEREALDTTIKRFETYVGYCEPLYQKDFPVALRAMKELRARLDRESGVSHEC